MKRTVKFYLQKSRQKLEAGIKQVTKTHKQREKERQDNEYLRVKNGEACAMCGKDNELCTCGVNDDWREDEQQNPKTTSDTV